MNPINAAAQPALPVFVDAHVHIYPPVGLESVFAAVLDNVREPPRRSVLVLADPGGVDGFGRLRALGNRESRPSVLPGWTVQSTGSDQVGFRHDDGSSIVFLNGRQLVTAEGLEVLAVGADNSLRDNLSLSRTLGAVRARGGLSAIAWGVGKWLGRRGRLVSEAVRAEAGSSDVVLGDNGGRPWWWARVPQFDLAAEVGMRILPGSDPLPIRGDEKRIASYGFEIALAGETEEELPAMLKSALGNPSFQIRVRGKRVGTWRFGSNQIRVRAESSRFMNG